jgi:SNF2 family DNA or RNA helicase
MLIHKPTQKVVLNLRNPERVTTVVPTAKKFTYKGVELVAVPHRLDETRVLRNLGFDVPSPIRHHYQWPGQYKPFHAQAETAEFLTLNPRAFCLNDMGTGKTLATLWSFDYLRSVGKARKMLVVSPLSTLERTWADEVFRHFPHLTAVVLYGTKLRRQKLLREDVDIYLVNHDGLKVIEADLIARDDIDVLVVDEVASFRNASTGRWKSLHKVAKGKPFLWGLTGTPTPNSPTDAWAQVRLIAPDRVPAYYGKFRDAVMKQVNQFKWAPRENATEIVAYAMQPAIRFRREDCVDLPPCMVVDRHASMSDEQAAAYRAMLAKLSTEVEERQILAVNEAVKLSKLVQIACGVVYTTDGSEVVIPAPSRIAAVMEVVEQAPGKVIVFVPFTGVLRYVADEISKEGWSVATISGATPKAQRDEIFGNFQNSPEPRVLVAQPAAMSHGLTLTAANTVVWYAPITSNEVYEQANARVTRPGQKLHQLIVNIEASPVERRIYERLKGKQALQGLLLETLR